MNALTLGDTIADTTDRLDALAAELDAYGWAARLDAPADRIPCLHARCPEPGATAAGENIYVQRKADGTWTYWWAWAEPIATTPADAAAAIVRALRRPASREEQATAGWRGVSGAGCPG